MKRITTQFLSCAVLSMALSAPIHLFAQPPQSKVSTATIAKHASELGLSAADLLNYRISDSYTDKASGAGFVYLQQTWKGVDVFNAIKTVAIKDDKVFSVAGTYVTDIAAVTKGKEARTLVAAADAVKAAARHLSLSLPAVAALKASVDEAEFAKMGISSINVKAKRLWIYDEITNQATLTWQVQIQPLGQPDYWLINVDATKGNVFSKINLTVSCDWRHPVHASDILHTQAEESVAEAKGPGIDTSKLPDGAAYRVVPFPAASPTHPGGQFRFDVNPWKLAGKNNPATSYKWYMDSLGSYDSSRSNNVLAQEDLNGNNGFGIGARSLYPAPHLVFQREADLTKEPTINRNQQAAITNLFYWNNIMHDVSYQYGFDEVSGNFQSSNLGRGGKNDDYVLADAQDGSGTDNANFGTPSDGFNPRMQMFLWSAAPEVKVTKPSAFSGLKEATESAFSNNNKLIDKGPVSGEVVLVNDSATGTAHTACGTLYNASSLVGKIALLDRGGCNFSVKVKNAQNAGAIAVIVANNVAGAPITMGGTDNSVTIPAVMIALGTADSMKQYLALDSVVTVHLKGGIRFDGDLDNSIIAHEYTHGISTRLTGGPSVATCLNNAEQAGEGWSDYMSLMVTTDWKKATLTDGANKRTIGTYVLGQTPDGAGIRAYPYSTDLSVNPWTYAQMTSSGGEVHTIGEIWCATIWDMTWNIIQQTGVINPNIYDAASQDGNTVALQLVVEGLKLQPCRPGFIDARNAILKADTLLYGGAYSAAIWKAFARRGMGIYASQGSANNTKDQTADFTEPTPALPIAKGAFNAVKQNNSAVLSWSQLATSNNSAIRVERTTDGKTFTVIGTTTASATTFTDATPADGKNSYRLSQTDKSGNKVVTDLRTINFKMVSITPNPTKDFIAITVNGNIKPLTITLLGSNGQKISSYTMNNSFRQINLPSVAPGVYYVTVAGEDVTYKGRIVIQ